MADLTGHDLGRYHLTEKLGEGGMAVVYKAYDTRLETDVAVKVIRTENLAPSILERSLKRFEREAKALARLTHPNIVSVKDYGEYEGKPYLVMSYLPGGTLKQKLGKPIPWQEAFKLLLPIAQALDFAHDQNMIHRDVKPSNVLLTLRGQPMLTDFGIAKILDLEETADLTGTGMGLGTPEYMAPEQWTGKATARSDQYALGVVLYEMLTGRKPYTADTPAAVLIQLTTDPLPSPKKFTPDLPDKVENFLLKAMSKDPGNRFANMDELSRAMEGLLSGSPLHSGEGLEVRSGRPAKTQTVAELDLEEPIIKALPVKPNNSVEMPVEKVRRKVPLGIIGGAVLGIALISGLLDLGARGVGPLAGLDTNTATNTPTAISTSTPTKTIRPTDTVKPTRTNTPFPTSTPVLTFSIDGKPDDWIRLKPIAGRSSPQGKPESASFKSIKKYQDSTNIYFLFEFFQSSNLDKSWLELYIDVNSKCLGMHYSCADVGLSVHQGKNYILATFDRNRGQESYIKGLCVLNERWIEVQIPIEEIKAEEHYPIRLLFANIWTERLVILYPGEGGDPFDIP